MQEPEHVRADNGYKQADILFAVFLLGRLESLTSVAITPLSSVVLFFPFFQFSGVKISGAGDKRA